MVPKIAEEKHASVLSRRDVVDVFQRLQTHVFGFSRHVQVRKHDPFVHRFVLHRRHARRRFRRNDIDATRSRPRRTRLCSVVVVVVVILLLVLTRRAALFFHVCRRADYFIAQKAPISRRRRRRRRRRRERRQVAAPVSSFGEESLRRYRRRRR